MIDSTKKLIRYYIKTMSVVIQQGGENTYLVT